MCMCLYPPTIETSSLCNYVLGTLECMNQQSCVKSIILDASAKYPVSPTKMTLL